MKWISQINQQENRWQPLKVVVADIRFWIVLFFLIRLFGITDAPLETGHNWRQSLTNMVARNFSQIDPNIFYPRIDMAGNLTGIIGTEFPFFNYLIYACNEFFGHNHWHGRLINLLVSSAGIYFFYRLIRELFNRQIALYSALLMLSSIWFSFSRKSMPDTFSVALVMVGLYFGFRYLSNGKVIQLILFGAFTTIGILCKIPALSLLAVLAVVPFVGQTSNTRKMLIMTVFSVGVLLVSWWYFYWVPHLVATYHFPLYFPKSIGEGWREIIPFVGQYLERFYFSALHAFTALPFLIAGIWGIFRSKRFWVKVGLVLITLTFVAFTIKTGDVFPKHNYYIIPFVPLMAFLVAYGIWLTPVRFRYYALALIMVEGVANQYHDFLISDSEKHKLSLETIMNEHVPKNALIIINGGQSPQEIYFANRRGWSLEPDEINQQLIDSLSSRGAQYLIWNHHRQPIPEMNYSIYSDLSYSVIPITAPR